MRFMRILPALAAAAMVTACGGSTVATQTTPSSPIGPVTKYRNTLPGQNASAPIDLVQSILVFAPGAASSVHTHRGPNLATVLEGQITVMTLSGDKLSSAGARLQEPVGQPVQAVNAGPVEAMVAGAFPVPHGTKPTAAVAGQPAPATPNKTLYGFTLDAPSITGGYSVVQQVLDFAPGAQTPRHRHGGPGVVTVIQGQVTLNVDGKATTYSVGESFTETPGQKLQASNRGTTDAVVVAAFLLPDGDQLTTNL